MLAKEPQWTNEHKYIQNGKEGPESGDILWNSLKFSLDVHPKAEFEKKTIYLFTYLWEARVSTTKHQLHENVTTTTRHPTDRIGNSTVL